MIKSQKKLIIFVSAFFIIIFIIIAARYFVGQYFQKKFSVRPDPGVFTQIVEKSNFYESIETFGTAIALNSKTYRVKKDELVSDPNIDGRFIKQNETIVELKNGQKIVADFNGNLGKREIAQGVLGTNSIIITLDDTSKIVIDIKIPENYISILKDGLNAEINTSAFTNTFNGKITSVSSRVDPSTRSILARVTVENKNSEIIPGQLLTVKIIYNENNEVGVPESALTIQGTTAFVYVVKNKEMVEKRNVVIGKRNFGKVSIKENLAVGEEIVTEGVTKVRDKGKIKIIEPGQKNTNYEKK